MYFTKSILIFVIPLALSAPSTERAAGPSVTLGGGTTVIGSTLLGVDSFKGIPYAQPPIGALRLKPPQALNSSLGTIQATTTPTACPQFFSQANTGSILSDGLSALLDSPLLQKISNDGEDCLNLNVQRPSNATASSKLPVVFWIFGGGFEFGSTQTYDATELIGKSMAQGKDIVFVAVNYRVGGFGFLPGKEVLADGSANLGLLDQRLGLQWVADNIASFGGDPSRVTIWGESAGAISVFDQMALYNGNNVYNGAPLFRAAIMDSGSVVPANPVDSAKGQVVYDTVVKNAGCGQATDTLECLRAAPYETFLNAANSVPAIFGFTSVALSYLPRPDNVTLIESPDLLAKSGSFTRIPFIIGDQEDEGTLFSLEQSNITTTAELENYLSTIFFNDATPAQISDLVTSYPDDPTAGSPFRTGLLNNIYPQYKRIAALLGDATFTLTRRAFLAATAAVSPSTPTYSYLNSYGSGTPVLGTFHASDILQVFGELQDPASTTIQSYYLAFFNSMDPNDAQGEMTWPLWSQGNMLMNFNLEGGAQLLGDTFRNESFAVLVENQGSFHI